MERILWNAFLYNPILLHNAIVEISLRKFQNIAVVLVCIIFLYHAIIHRKQPRSSNQPTPKPINHLLLQ